MLIPARLATRRPGYSLGPALYESGVNDYRPVLRALLAAMQEWLTTGKEPPPSAYSNSGQLAALNELKFPSIPGLIPPTQVRRAMRLDFGPQFRTAGIIANEPAETVGEPFASKLPQLDPDGNELGGIRLPMTAVPLATHLAWNMVDPNHYRNGEMMGLNGSHIAFARTRAQREASHDPRPSIEERYKNREDYLAKVKLAAGKLVTQGYLLAKDAPMVVEQCAKHWDLLAAR